MTREQRLARTTLLMSPAQMERLAHAHVMLLGLGGVGGHADDLHPLGLVHVEEAFHEVTRAVDEALNRGIEVVAELLGEEDRCILEVDEAAFRGGIALARLLGEGGVLLPGVDGHVLRPGEQLVGVDRAQQRVAQAKQFSSKRKVGNCKKR